MRVFLAAAVIALLPFFALADEGSIVTYTSLDHDFSLALPGGGVISDAYSDPNWEVDDSNTVMRWEATADGPVALLMASALPLEAEATDDDISKFVEGYTGSIGEEDTSSVENVSAVFQIGNRGWISVLAKESSGEPVWFEAYITRQGSYIYTVVFFYNSNDGSGAAVAKDVLATFTTSQG
jgi:hypothetical protein